MEPSISKLNTDPDKDPSHRAKIKWVLLAVLFLLIVAGLFSFWLVFERSVDEKEIFADVDDSHLVYQPRDIPEEDNSYYVWVELDDEEVSYPENYPSRPEYDHTNQREQRAVRDDLLATGSLSKEQIGFIEELRELNQPLLSVWDRAKTTPDFQYPGFADRSDVSVLPYGLINNLSLIKILEARAQAATGEPAQAMEDLFSVLDFSYSLSDQPVYLIGALVSIDLAEQTVKAMEQVVERAEFTPEERSAFADRLEDHKRSGNDIANGFIMEYSGKRELIKLMAQGEYEFLAEKVGMEEEMLEAANSEYWDSQLAHRLIFEDYDLMYNNALRDCDEPLEELEERWRDWEEIIEEGMEGALSKMLHMITIADFSSARDRSCERDAQIEALQEKLRS